MLWQSWLRSKCASSERLTSNLLFQLNLKNKCLIEKKYGCFILHCDLAFWSASLYQTWFEQPATVFRVSSCWCSLRHRYFRDHKCFDVGSHLTDRMAEKLQRGNKIVSRVAIVSAPPITRCSRSHNASSRFSFIASTVKIRMLAVAGVLVSAKPRLTAVGQRWLALVSRFMD